MSISGDENPNPQWQRPQGSQWQSGSPLGGTRTSSPRGSGHRDHDP